MDIKHIIERYNTEDEFLNYIAQAVNTINNNKTIRYKYTDDQYGKSAKEIHANKNMLSRAYKGDAGIDLPIVLSDEDIKHGFKRIWPNEREMLHTGIIMEFPIGYYGRIIHRSSTEKTHRLRVIEGIIDDYRGEILVQVHNQNSSTVDVYHGDRLSQLILSKSFPFKLENATNLRPSTRGAKGFGSSGK